MVRTIPIIVAYNYFLSVAQSVVVDPWQVNDGVEVSSGNALAHSACAENAVAFLDHQNVAHNGGRYELQAHNGIAIPFRIATVVRNA